jgi:hypothetical protein
VFSRARRHCRRFARWYLAAVVGSVVYREYVLCGLTADSHRPPLAGAIRGQPVAMAHSVLRRGQLSGQPLEAVPASGRNESVQVVILTLTLAVALNLSLSLALSLSLSLSISLSLSLTRWSSWVRASLASWPHGSYASAA